MRVLLLVLALPLAAAGAVPQVPSGQPVALQEVIWPKAGGAGEKIARFRFVAPKLRKGAGNEDDMMALCEAVARPAVAQKGLKVDQIVISLAQAAVPFGEQHPEVAQVFEAYVIEAGHCALAGL